MSETHGPRPSDYDRQEFTIRTLVLFGVMLAAIVGAALWGAHNLQARLTGKLSEAQRAGPPRQSAENLLGGQAQMMETGRNVELLRAEEERVLHNYGWVSREQGIVHIPIERAMELVLREGFQAVKTPTTTPAQEAGSERQ